MGITKASSESCMTCHVIIWILCISTASLPVSGVLNTTPAAVDGKLIACAGTQISLMCTHTNIATGRTTWRFSPPINCSRSLLHDPVPDNIGDCGPFSFEGVTHLTPGVTQLSSTAVATVSSRDNGTVVECSDKSSVFMTNIGNVSLCIIDEPTLSPPVNTRDGVEITWSSVTAGCASNVNYTVAVTRQGDAPDNITFLSVVTDPVASVVVDNVTDGQDYTVYVTASVKSCNTPTVPMNFTADRSANPGGGSEGVGNKLGVIVAAVIVPVILVVIVIIIVTTFALVCFCHKDVGRKTVPNSDKINYANMNFSKQKKGNLRPVEDNSRVVYSEVSQGLNTGTVDSTVAQDINCQQQPASEERSSSQPVEQGHDDTVTNSTTPASAASLSYDTVVDQQSGSGVEPRSTGASGIHHTSSGQSTSDTSYVTPVTISTLTGGQYHTGVNKQANSRVGQPSRRTPTSDETSALHSNASSPLPINESHSKKPAVSPRTFKQSGGYPGEAQTRLLATWNPSHVGGATSRDAGDNPTSRDPLSNHNRRSSGDTDRSTTIPKSGRAGNTGRNLPSSSGYPGLVGNVISKHDSGDNESSLHQDVAYNRRPSKDTSAGRYNTALNSREQKRTDGTTRTSYLGDAGESSLRKSAGGSSHAGRLHTADRKDTYGPSQPRFAERSYTGGKYY